MKTCADRQKGRTLLYKTFTLATQQRVHEIEPLTSVGLARQDVLLRFEPQEPQERAVNMRAPSRVVHSAEDRTDHA